MGFEDEVWFSRFAQPALHAWMPPGERLRLIMHAADRDDPEAKALACYGLWLPGPERMLLRFVAGRPVSAMTCAFLAWATERLAAEGIRVLALIWDNAPWHVSREVRIWIRDHNRQVKAAGAGCRLLVCRVAEQKPVAEPDRAPMGARQAGRGRARAQAHRRGTPAAALPPLPLPAPAATRTAGELKLH